MYELSVTSDIACAHFVRGHEGKCKNLHGHTWKVEISIQSHQLDSIGMVADFAVIKKQLREFLSVLDHTCLNDLDYFKQVNPTSENIARYIYEQFSQIIRPLKLSKVRVWESDTSSITYRE